MTAGGPNSWGSARRILCVRLDGMGDVLMTSPAIRAVKGEKARHITLLASPAAAAVAGMIPEIDDVIVYEAPWMKATPEGRHIGADLEMVERLLAGGFDAAVVFTVYSQNPLPAAFLCSLAGVPLRLAHCHENPYQLLTDWVPDPEPGKTMRHEVRRQLDLVGSVGLTSADERLSVAVPTEALRRVRALLGDLGVSEGRGWAVVHPGATAESRRYSVEGFAEAATRLVSEHGWDVVFTGTAAERGLVHEVRAAMGAPSFSVAGMLTVAELAALMEMSPVLIANNSGPVHLAAAVGTPVVVLYALTNPQHTPWGVPNRVLFHDVPCRFCYKSVCPEGHHHCLRLVPPDAVVRAVSELLDERTELGSGIGQDLLSRP